MGRAVREPRLAPSGLPLRGQPGLRSPSESDAQELHPHSGTIFWVPEGPALGPSPAALAGEAPRARVAPADAREVEAPGGDGDSLRAEDAANGSGGGGSHDGVLREGAEDGAGQGHHHGRGLDDDGGVLALPEAGLIAAVGQRGRATGRAWQAGVVAGHV